MLLQFNVSNYMSFKNEVVLSLVAGKENEHDEILIHHNKDRILPVAAIYGPNASGKSNVFKALDFAIRYVRNSNLFQIDTPVDVVPFLLDEESRKEKSRFDFIFVNNGYKYEYGFVIDSHNVYEEYLYEYRSQRPSMIFERENINQYRFSTATKKELSAIADKNTGNKLFLSTATMWNSVFTRNAYLWFSQSVDVYDTVSLKNDFPAMMNSHSDKSMKTFIIRMLKNADINISDFEIMKKEEESGFTFDTHHTVNVNGTEKDYILPLLSESNGTLNFLYMTPMIKKTLEEGRTMIIDELDTGLHPALVRYLIEVFHDKDKNPNGAQLLFNTHDVIQLDLGVFRRDQIYFTEKDNRTGVSDLYALDEYAPRKTENIQKGYLQGRYGAIPTIGFEGMEW